MVGTTKPGWRLFLYCVKLARIVNASAKALNRTELPSFTSWKAMLIYPCTKCMYCCWDPTTQSNGLGPIWYLQPKLGFRRNSFMSLRPWHVPLAWHVSPKSFIKHHKFGPRWKWEARKLTRTSLSATSVYPKNLSPASSNLPCFFKSMAKLFTQTRVSGCWAPSWDSPPSKAWR